MRSNKWLIILAVLVIAGLAGWWWLRSPASDTAKEKAADKLTPTLSVASLNISDIDNDRIKVKSKITLVNPLPVDIKTNQLDYTIYIDSIKVIEDAYKKPISILSSDSTVIELPIEILTKPMTRVLKYFDDKKIDSADYSIRASFAVDVPIAGERNFKLNMSKRLPAIRIPKIEVKDVDLHAFKLKDKGVDVMVHVINPNPFPMKMQDGAFSFAIEDDMKMNGVVEKTVSIPAHGAEDLSMHAAITQGNALKGGWKFLTDKKDTKFVFLFKGKLMSDNKALNNSKMAMNMHGTLQELVNAAKEIKESAGK